MFTIQNNKIISESTMDLLSYDLALKMKRINWPGETSVRFHSPKKDGTSYNMGAPEAYGVE